MSAKKRRQYGTGSVFQRKDGRWVGTLQAGWTSRGTRRTISVTARSEAEAKRRLDARRKQIDREGLPSEGALVRTTVAGFAKEWLPTEARRLRPLAYNATRSAVETWIVPTIGRRRLVELTPGDVRAVATAQRQAGRATSTALRTHVVLVQLLKAAMLEGHQVPARVLLTERPGVNANDRQAMDVEQAAAVLEAAVELGLPHVSRWVAALLQGLRQGEALGLTWDALDRRADVMDISWQLQPLPYVRARDPRSGFRIPDGFEARRLTGALHLTRPKTAKGKRVIPVVPWMRQALLDWRDVAPPSPHGLVWSAVDGAPASAKDDLEEWKALQATAGVAHPAGRYYVGHETRHTTVSLLVEAGVDRSVIEAIVGHAKLVDAYVHAPAHLASDALDRVAARLGLPAGG